MKNINKFFVSIIILLVVTGCKREISNISVIEDDNCNHKAQLLTEKK